MLFFYFLLDIDTRNTNTFVHTSLVSVLWYSLLSLLTFITISSPSYRGIKPLGRSKHVLFRSWFKKRHNNITLSCVFHPTVSPSLEQRLLSTAVVPWDTYSEFLWIAVLCLNTYFTHSSSLLGWGVVTACGSNESTAAAVAVFYRWISWGQTQISFKRRESCVSLAESHLLRRSIIST